LYDRKRNNPAATLSQTHFASDRFQNSRTKHLLAEWSTSGATRRARSTVAWLTADLNSSYSPAVACHDALRNEVAIAARFRVVAAEAGRVAAPAPETTYAPGG